MGMSARGFAMNRIPARHVKTTLPPTLRGFPGEAEISYFVKATVQRQGLFKENARSRTPFQFIPIEPPRPALTGELSFARQQHTFYHNSKRAGKKSIFSFTTPTQEQGPSFSFDMRLPEPAILTCNQPLPLSIVFTKLNTSTGVVYLQSLQISLIAFTKIRTHDLERTESSSWIIMSKSNLGTTAINGRDPEGHQLVLDDTSWKHSPLPNTVAPSFATCNISRSYQVEVRASFSYGGATFDGLKVRARTVFLDVVRACYWRGRLVGRNKADTFVATAYRPQSAAERIHLLGHCATEGRTGPTGRAKHLERATVTVRELQCYARWSQRNGQSRGCADVCTRRCAGKHDRRSASSTTSSRRRVCGCTTQL